MGAGVEFIPADDETSPGLRLKHKLRGKRVKQAGHARQISLNTLELSRRQISISADKRGPQIPLLFRRRELTPGAREAGG
jgi:hypothetical protein